MKKIILVSMFFILVNAVADAKHTLPEKYYQNVWCGEHNGIVEYVLSDGTRVDCLTKDYAVEFDFAPKWAESIGQSLYYAKKTARNPGIVLIIESNKDLKYYYRIENLCAEYGISLWYMKKPDKSVEYREDVDLITYILNLFFRLIEQLIKLLNSL